MSEPNPDRWAQSRMRWLVPSRWDKEEGTVTTAFDLQVRNGLEPLRSLHKALPGLPGLGRHSSGEPA